MPTLAHLSDLHLGQSEARSRRAQRLVRSLLAEGVDHVVLTGDVTHSGRLEEHRRYLDLFAPLRERELLTVVPGNHDRGGDDVAELLSDGLRVAVDAREDLFLVCIDSTAPHNVSSWRAHGELGGRTLEAVDQALALAPPGRLRCVLLHHHLLPLPVEGLGEWLAHQLGWPHAGELPLGRELLRQVRGRCDLVLHGHRHVPRHLEVQVEGAPPLQLFNAGSTTELGAYRVFTHHQGRLASARWVRFEARARAGALDAPAAAVRLTAPAPGAAR